MFTQEQLVRALADRVPATRRKAAGALFVLGMSLAVEALTKWTSDSDFLALLLPNRDYSDEEASAGEAIQLGSRFRATVGIAADQKTFELIRECNGSPELADVPPDQDAIEFELHLQGEHFYEGEIAIDVLTSKAPSGDGAIAKFLAKRGPGIQQLEFEVSDVDRTTQILADKFGVKAIYPATRAGANGTRVNFFLVANPDGQKVLIELVEPAKK